MDGISIFDLITTVATTATALFAFGIFFYNRRQRQFEILEQSFDLMQRINETALSSDENLIAAVRSGNLADETDIEAARHAYFQYMRINRILRAYEYNRGGFLSDEQRDRIIDSHIATLKPAEKNLRSMLERGYPEDFKDFIVTKVAKARPIPAIAHKSET